MTVDRRGDSRRARGDAGAGVFSTAFGVLMFLCFLLLAVQVLFNLYAVSVVTSVTYDAARSVATGESSREQAVVQAKDRLGGYATNVTFEWLEESSTDTVRLHVHANNPRILPERLVSAVGFDEIDRTVEVRTERQR